MFRRILVPLDGTARAEQALPVAARLAGASGGTVVLLRVVNPLSELAPYYPSDSEMVRGMVEAEEATALSYLDSVTHMSLLAGVQTETAVMFGQPTSIILAEVDARRIDLVVMCSHGHTGMKRWMLGSVAEEIVHHAPVPVLVLREERSLPLAPGGQASGPLRALVPLDGSASAQAALTPAAQLVAALSSPDRGALHLARVVVLPDAQESSQSERAAILQEARHSLESTVEHLREGLVAAPAAELKPSLSCSVTIDDDIASGICRLAEDGEGAAGSGRTGGADIIAMATHGFGGLQRWAVGSVTERVLHTTRLPLLIVRPPGVAGKSHLFQGGTVIDTHKDQKGEVI
jgi:nucleotide-binding universal stress UspA family protein